MKILPIKFLFIFFLLSGLSYAQENPPTTVDQMPRFPGCEDMKGTTMEKQRCAEQKMLEFIYTRIKYPKIARENDIEGMVVISFIIEKDGSKSNINILRDLGGGCGKEALRVVNEMPNWIPGKDKGELVRVQFNLPVRFKMKGGENPPSKREGYVNFTLHNTGNSAYSVFMPMGLVTIPPRSTKKVMLPEGYQLRRKKRSKEITLFTVSPELEAKTIDMKKTIKKRRLVIQ